MLAILSNLYQNNSSKNWGVILESGKDIEKQDMILLAMNDALEQATKAMEDKMGNVSSGLAGLF